MEGTLKFNAVDLNKIKKLLLNNVLGYIVKTIKINKKFKQPVINKKELVNITNPIFKDKAEEFRRDLIKNKTYHERIIIEWLNNMGIEYDFQKIIYSKNCFYIVDFYLPKFNIVLEIDGGYHDLKEQRNKDNIRTINLKNHNRVQSVIRVTNDQITNSFSGMVKMVKNKLMIK